jgi:hypothetical protein
MTVVTPGFGAFAVLLILELHQPVSHFARGA